MKIILSRKGFDSANGGYPSPILPDGSLLSVPIPSRGDGLTYSDLYFGEISYSELLSDLYPSILYQGVRIEDFDGMECHLDPDLVKSTLTRDTQWRAAFGQVGGSQTHLENYGVGIGDLFLFFGWFRETNWENDRLVFKRDSPHLHVIYGYLEVSEIHRGTFPRWLDYHPHLTNKKRLQSSTNTIYVGARRSSLGGFPGYGVFRFSKGVVLTKDGYSRSRWNLPEFFRNLSISHHSPKSWKADYFQSVPIGQEFVVEESDLVTQWAKALIMSHQI